ncbi:MFS general substrate transporter [Chytriomyces sp. MP71]|nr:MFS general substrate transporter [Chytriomyces sp. MP71]
MIKSKLNGTILSTSMKRFKSSGCVLFSTTSIMTSKERHEVTGVSYPQLSAHEAVSSSSRGLPREAPSHQSVADSIPSHRCNSSANGYHQDLVYSAEEEATVRLILDLRLMPFVLFSTFILNMDRTNLSNAISDNLPADLGFTTAVVNNANSMYAVLFSIAAFSGAILGKYFGPHKYIPFLVLAWGLTTTGHGFIHNAPQYYLLRALIALTEGGVIPATLIYLGTFYKRNELATRLSWFWGVQSVASAVSGLMASGILQLRGKSGLFGWSWLFVIDGVITILAAFLLYFVFPRTPYYTKGLLFGNWLTERQATIAVTRVVRDDLLKLDYEVKVKFSDVWDALTDYRVWGHLIITSVGLTWGSPYATYLPSIIKSFGFNVYVSNALTAPNYILGFITMTLMTAHSDKVGERGFHGVFSHAWILIGILLLQFLPDSAPRGVFYLATLILSGHPSTHPMNIAWMTENTGPIGKRTVASGLVIGAANIYAVWASQIYQPWDAPRYHFGNYVLIAFEVAALLLWLGQKFLYVHLNKTRGTMWKGMSEDEKVEYDAMTKHTGSQRFDFIFKT